MLTPYRGNSDRITLLKATSIHPEYESLDLSIREIPSVFMSTPLGGSPPPTALPFVPVCTHFLKASFGVLDLVESRS